MKTYYVIYIRDNNEFYYSHGFDLRLVKSIKECYKFDSFAAAIRELEMRDVTDLIGDNYAEILTIYR